MLPHGLNREVIVQVVRDPPAEGCDVLRTVEAQRVDGKRRERRANFDLRRVVFLRPSLGGEEEQG